MMNGYHVLNKQELLLTLNSIQINNESIYVTELCFWIQFFVNLPRRKLETVLEPPWAWYHSKILILLSDINASRRFLSKQQTPSFFFVVPGVDFYHKHLHPAPVSSTSTCRTQPQQRALAGLRWALVQGRRRRLGCPSSPERWAPGPRSSPRRTCSPSASTSAWGSRLSLTGPWAESWSTKTTRLTHAWISWIPITSQRFSVELVCWRGTFEPSKGVTATKQLNDLSTYMYTAKGVITSKVLKGIKT